MTLQASGAISLGNVNTELGLSATANIGMNSSNVRTLAGVASGAISMSNFHGKSNIPSGALWAWGSNSGFQLGLGSGDNTSRSSPVQVGTATTWKFASSSNLASFFIKTDGTLWVSGLGSNTYELGLGGASATTSMVQVGSATNWVQITTLPNYNSAGSASVGLRSDGSLWFCGNNYQGFSGLGTTAVSYYTTFQQVPGNWIYGIIGGDQIYGIRSDTTLWGWGFAGNTGILLGAGTAGSWYSSPIQIGSASGWKKVVGVLRGTSKASYAVKTDGTLWAWGYNNLGQLGQNDNVNRSVPTQIGGTTWVDCVYGMSALGLKSDGTIWGWANSPGYSIGNGTTTTYSSPVQIGNLNTWKSISAVNGAVNFAMKTDGTLWAWGAGGAGQIGNSSLGTPVLSPVQVTGTWKYISFSGYSDSGVFGIK